MFIDLYVQEIGERLIDEQRFVAGIAEVDHLKTGDVGGGESLNNLFGEKAVFTRTEVEHTSLVRDSEILAPSVPRENLVAGRVTLVPLDEKLLTPGLRAFAEDVLEAGV